MEKLFFKYADEYFRIKLLTIYKKCAGKPILIEGKYKHNENKKWATFINIKPYIQYRKNKFDKFCDHINIDRKIIDKFYLLTDIDNYKRFLIIANIEFYNWYGRERIGIKLFEDNQIIPILKFNKSIKLRKGILEKCYIYEKDDLQIKT